MRAWLGLLTIAIGCYDDPVRHCPVVDCPSNLVCDNQDGCAFKEQLEQCDDQADGTACAYPGVDDGECVAELCLPSGCGNGILTSSEVCDDGNTTNGDGCSADCRSLETCGNGIPDFAAGETCDCGTAAGTGPACNGLPNSDADTGSPCRANCQLRRCGDGTLDAIEQCEANDLDGKTCADLGFYDGTLACSELCTFDTSSCTGTCGDGALEATREQCDGTEFGALTCQSFGFQTGDLTCNAGCAIETSGCSGRCGDAIRNGGEQCDAADLGSPAATCLDVGFYGGDLGCSTSCTFDVGECEGTCGDDDKNGPEQCDGTDLDGADCTDAGFYQGTLACNAICGFDTSSCTGFCGDDVINGGEQCDTDNFGGLTCASFGFYTGELSCTIGCTLFIGACDERCGDGELNGPEACDGADVGTATCANIDPEKFTGTGPLGCSARCDAIDTKGCARLDDTKCDADLGETCFNSLEDCKGREIFCCGNGVCSPAENRESCAVDCE